MIFLLLISFQNISAQRKSIKKPLIINCGVCNQKIISLPQPVIPSFAEFVCSKVEVQILVDEKGNVETANAISGNPLLRASAEEAALKAKFKPFKLSGTPVKIRTKIVYNFVGKSLGCSDCPSGKFISSPKPNYSAEAEKAKVSGQVQVQVLVDEQGNVICAKTLSGHPLLQAEAEKAALQAKFIPAKMGETPIKFYVVITYDFHN